MKTILKISLLIFIVFMILKLIYEVKLNEVDLLAPENFDTENYQKARKEENARRKKLPDDFEYKNGFLKDGEIFTFSQGNNDVEIKAINNAGYPRRIIKVGNVLNDTKRRLKKYPSIGIYGPNLGFRQFTTPVHFIYTEYFDNFKDYNSLIEEMKISRETKRSFLYFLNEKGIAPILIVRKNPKGNEIFIQVSLTKILIDWKSLSPEELKEIFQRIESIQ